MIPKITIAIPAYNASKYIGQTLDSIIRQVDPPPYEVIVVEDASTDETAQIAQNHPIQPVLYRNIKNLGPPRTFNKCVDLARGEYVFILHADDLIHPKFIHTMTKFLDQNTEAGFAFCLSYIIDSAGTIIEKQKPFFSPGLLQIKDFLWGLALRNRIMTPTVVVRKSAYHAVGDYDIALTHTCDYNMWLRLASRFPCIFIPKYLAYYRMHESSHTRLTAILERTRQNYLSVENGVSTEIRMSRKWRLIRWNQALLSLELYPELFLVHETSKEIAKLAKETLDIKFDGFLKVVRIFVRLVPHNFREKALSLLSRSIRALIYSIVAPRAVVFWGGVFQSRWSKLGSNEL